jgi:hypothetical protein
MPAEIQLLPCGYSACCSVDQCQFRATTLVRYTDNQGRPLQQWELCDRHADWLRVNSKNVREMDRPHRRVYGDTSARHPAAPYRHQ